MKKKVLYCQVKEFDVCPICGSIGTINGSDECCPKCLNRIEEINNYLSSHNYSLTLTPDDVINMKKRLDIESVFSDLGKVKFYPILMDLKLGKDMQPTEQKRKIHICSKGEKLVEEFLKETRLPYSTQYNTLKCINPITGKQLPYDFELTDFGIIIEVQGKQHYQYTPFFHDGSRSQQYNYQVFKDKIKRDFAISQGYKFLVLSPTDFESDAYKRKIVSAILDRIKNIQKCIKLL